MIVDRSLRALAIMLLASGGPASGQEFPRRGSLADLGGFSGITDLASEEDATELILEALKDPGIQFEYVAIHAYTPSDACREDFVMTLANDYGALVLESVDSTIEGRWFNKLDDACNIVRGGDSVEAAEIPEFVKVAVNGIPRATQNMEILYNNAKDDAGDEGAAFVYMTAPLPFTNELAAFHAHCALEETGSLPKDSACYHNLSRSYVPEHQELWGG